MTERENRERQKLQPSSFGSNYDDGFYKAIFCNQFTKLIN